VTPNLIYKSFPDLILNRPGYCRDSLPRKAKLEPLPRHLILSLESKKAIV